MVLGDSYGDSQTLVPPEPSVTERFTSFRVWTGLASRHTSNSSSKFSRKGEERAALIASAEHHEPDPQWTAGVRLMLTDPALFGEYLKANAAAEQEIAAAVAERTGTKPTDMYPRLVAAATGAAHRVATDQWLHADPPVPLWPLIRDSLRLTAAGLPDPSVS